VVLLYDLARVETRLGHEEQAIAYLKQYVDQAPNANDVLSVRAEIAAREQAADQKRRTALAEAQAATAKAEIASARVRDELRRQDTEKRARTGARYGGIASLAVGAAALAGGIACGVLASRDGHTVSGGGATTPQGMAVAFTGTFGDAQSQGHLTQPLGIALDVIGAAVIGTGIALVVYGTRRKGREHAAASMWQAF
jgi:hypothetical protein